MEIQKVSFPTQDGSMRGWLCEPESPSKPGPAVIVVHEATGLVPNIKPILRRFAENGYTALAPNLFDKPGSKVLCVARTMLTMMTGRGEALADLEAAKGFLKSRAGVDGDRLAVAGFCMGGGFSLLLALTPDIKASAPYYGTSNAYFEQIEKSCPVVASYGGRDALMAKQAPRLAEALARTSIPHEVKTYERSGHSYMTEDQPGLLFQIGKAGPMKVGYNPDDAEDSWRRMLAFFAEHV